MSTPDTTPPERRPRLRFGLSTILVVMLVIAMIATGAGYLVRAASLPADQSRAFSMRLEFLLFTLASPVLLMILLSLGRRLLLWMGRKRS